MKGAFGPFALDSRTRELTRDGRVVHLSPKAFDLLQMLLERRPAVVGKAEIQDRIWPGTFVEDASVSVLIADIRRALDDDPRAPSFVRTAHGRGYAFSGAVQELRDEVPAERKPPAGPRVWLVWREHTRSLSPGRNVVGRDPACEVWIDARGVSRRHASIVVDGDRATVEDLGSTNGTFVGPTRIEAVGVLADGDVIGLGPEALTFRAWSDAGPPATEPVPRRRPAGKR